jgi:hypothetical protein
MKDLALSSVLAFFAGVLTIAVLSKVLNLYAPNNLAVHTEPPAGFILMPTLGIVGCLFSMLRGGASVSGAVGVAGAVVTTLGSIVTAAIGALANPTGALLIGGALGGAYGYHEGTAASAISLSTAKQAAIKAANLKADFAIAEAKRQYEARCPVPVKHVR